MLALIMLLSDLIFGSEWILVFVFTCWWMASGSSMQTVQSFDLLLS